jgi:hypothetical protein
MRISTPFNPQYYQPPLFDDLGSFNRKLDRPIYNMGTCRTVLGDLIETLTAKIFNGQRHKTDSRCDYCPDISIPREIYGRPNPTWCFLPPGRRNRYQSQDLVYFECKGCGKNGDCITYKGRLAKDVAFAKRHQLYYCIWHHKTTCHISTGNLEASTRQLIDSFLLSVKGVYILPLTEIVRLAAVSPQLTFSSKIYGDSGNPKYKHGYRLRLKDIKNAKHTFLDYRVEV